MKDQNKQTIRLVGSVLFDHQYIDRITFDLIHINQGWDDQKHDYTNNKRSSYTAIDILDFFEQFRYFTIEWTLGINKELKTIKGRIYYRYYWETTDDEGNTIRIILDIPQKKTGEGIIVTVFKP